MIDKRHCLALEGQRLSAADAAATAAAAHVYQSAYKQGLDEGWKAGWAAAFQDLSQQRHDREPAIPNSVVQQHSSSLEEDSSEEEAVFELTEEWAALFAKSSNRPRARQESFPTDGNASEQEGWDFGGISELKRRKEAEELYGDASERILQREAELAANFAQLASHTGASYWPVLSLKQAACPSD